MKICHYSKIYIYWSISDIYQFIILVNKKYDCVIFVKKNYLIKSLVIQLIDIFLSFRNIRNLNLRFCCYIKFKKRKRKRKKNYMVLEFNWRYTVHLTISIKFSMKAHGPDIPFSFRIIFAVIIAYYYFIRSNIIIIFFSNI